MGGGLTLAAACDIVLTEADAKWSLPEVPVGLFPAWGLDAVVRRVGVPAARRLAWGIDTLSGREAHALGLADEIVEGNVLSVAMERARAIAGLPSVQAQAVKRFFSTYCEDEAADIAANSLFMEMTKTAEADATFRRFGSGSVARKSTEGRTDNTASKPGPLGLFRAHSILKFFDLADVEKFKRRWARGERL